MRQDKKEFIQALNRFIRENDAVQSLSGDFYIELFNDGFEEFLYIIIDHGSCTSEKRINITGDSNQAIAKEFFNALGRWSSIDYLDDEEKIFAKRNLLAR